MSFIDVSTPAPLVLLADDDRALRKLLSLALSQDGYRCVQVSSGEQVLQDFQRLKPDLVLLDAVMPEMDGFRCCQHLREKLDSDVPILMVTVLDDQISIDRAFEVGATDYVTKPIHWAVLRQRVKRLLNGAQNFQQFQQLRAWEKLQRHIVRKLQSRPSLDLLLADTWEALLSIFEVDQIWLLQKQPVTLWASDGQANSTVKSEIVAAIAAFETSGNHPHYYPMSSGDALETDMLAMTEKLAHELEMSAFLLMPIIVGRTNWGWLILGRKEQHPWTRVMSDRVQDLSQLIAIALSLS